MGKVVVEIPNYEENITRPVAMTIVAQVAAELGIGKDQEVRFIGSGGSMPLAGSTMDDRNNGIRLPGDGNITIEVDEEYDPGFALTTAVMQNDNSSVFSDHRLQMYLKPIYHRVKATITFKVMAADKSTVDAWESFLKRRHAQGSLERYHTVNYHYPIPAQIMLIAVEAHRLRELNQGYGETFGVWWRANSNKRFTAIRDQAGRNSTLAVKEKQIAILGWYDFLEQPPKPEKFNDTGAWGINFSYIFYYDVPKSMLLEYPIMVHNQLMATKFFNTEKPPEIEDHNRYYSASMRVYQEFTFESHNAKAWMGRPGHPIPYFDTWLPKLSPSNSVDIFRIMLQTDIANPHAVISLGNLGAYQLSPAALAYMRKKPLSITQPYNNVFQLQMYKWDSVMPSNGIMVSPELDIHYTSPLNERDNYHLLLSMLTDITKLTFEALKDLSEFGVFAIEYLTILYPQLAQYKQIPSLSEDGVTIPLTDLIFFTDIVRGAVQTSTGVSPRRTMPGMPSPKVGSNSTVGLPRPTVSNLPKPPSSHGSLKPEKGWRLVNAFTILTKEA